MAKIEILGYFPNPKTPMADFLFFCVNGVPDGHGGWLPDEQGRLQTGVFFWLYSRNVPEAHFFNSDDSKDPAPVFGAAVERLEPSPVPWMDNIPGFNKLLAVDGELRGDGVSTFPSVGQPFATVVNNKALDEKFKTGRANVEKIIVSLNTDKSKNWTFTTDAFRLALRGDRGTDLRRMLIEITDKLGMSVL